MKHFKLNIERNYIPVADLCIAGIPENEHDAIIEAFTYALNDCKIAFDIIGKDSKMLIAKKIVTSWSISE